MEQPVWGGAGGGYGELGVARRARERGSHRKLVFAKSIFLAFPGPLGACPKPFGSLAQAFWEPANSRNNYLVEISGLRVYRLLGSLTQAFWEPANSKNNYLVEINVFRVCRLLGSLTQAFWEPANSKTNIWSK